MSERESVVTGLVSNLIFLVPITPSNHIESSAINFVLGATSNIEDYAIFLLIHMIFEELVTLSMVFEELGTIFIEPFHSLFA